MSINIQELKEISAKIFDFLEKNGKKELDLNNDLYWYIPNTICYDPYNIPDNKKLTLGEISSDIENLRNTNNQPIEYSLIWLASILRAAGDEMMNNKK